MYSNTESIIVAGTKSYISTTWASKNINSWHVNLYWIGMNADIENHIKLFYMP